MNANRVEGGADAETTARLQGCIRCGCWDRDENGQLMCCCEPERYAQFHPPAAQSSAGESSNG
jgi:hypothetical protein